MKTPLPVLFLLSVTACFGVPEITVPLAEPPSDEVLLAAIAEVETGHNAARVGRRGERTHLQIMPQTWRAYSRLPHAASARNLEETERVARAHLAHIRSRLRARGLPETPFYIAASWNAGPGWKRLRPRTISYAERVSNLVEAAQPAAVARMHGTPAPKLVFPSANASQSLANTSVPIIGVER